MRLKEKKIIILSQMLREELSLYLNSYNNLVYQKIIMTILFHQERSLGLILKKKTTKKKKCFLIGPPRDYHLVEGLNVEIVEDFSQGCGFNYQYRPMG